MRKATELALCVVTVSLAFLFGCGRYAAPDLAQQSLPRTLSPPVVYVNKSPE